MPVVWGKRGWKSETILKPYSSSGKGTSRKGRPAAVKARPMAENGSDNESWKLERGGSSYHKKFKERGERI